MQYLPQRPPEHVIGDRARVAVDKIFTDLGHAVEVVGNDYGEDLLVQIRRRDGLLDPARLWVQVRGTTAAFTRRSPSTSLKRGQLGRWSETADTVAIVLWQVIDGVGWYFVPNAYTEPADAARTTIHFDRDSSFTPESAERLVQRTRMDHLERQMVLAISSGWSPGEHGERSRSASYRMAIRAAKELGVFQDAESGLTIRPSFASALAVTLPGFSPGKTKVADLTPAETVALLYDTVCEHYRANTRMLTPPPLVCQAATAVLASLFDFTIQKAESDAEGVVSHIVRPQLFPAPEVELH
ncbi:hypothetical protein ABH935_007016 [Catenulispora sp. GAS73]|uniref:DUF4365 domain-containing protein n=1 Tax=Catenulispora sp. GAS73 TaxID=3156269 RepID=UPI0035148366